MINISILLNKCYISWSNLSTCTKKEVTWPNKYQLGMMQMKCLFYIPATWSIFCSLPLNEEVFLIGVSSLQLLNAKLPTFLG